MTERWWSEICTSQCLILWATVLEMVSNTELTSRATTGPWAIRVGCENEDVPVFGKRERERRVRRGYTMCD